MSQEGLVLFGGETPSDPIAWARVDIADGRVLAHGVAEETPPPAGAPARTALVLPGADAQMKRMELDARTEAQARAAAPYLFEGAVAAKEPMHYALGEAQGGAGMRLVAAMSEARLRAWLERCRAFGADPHWVSLDFLLWPTHPGEIEVHQAQSRVIVAAGKKGGFTIEPALAPALLARWLARQGEAPTRINVSGADAQAWRAALGEAGAALRVRDGVDPMAELAKGACAPGEHAPNFRQGAFAPEGDKPPPWRLWRFAAALAVIAVALQIAGLVVAGWRDHRAATEVMSAAQRDFRAARPDVQRITNLRAQVRGLANALNQSQNHPVLSVTDPLIRALEQQPLVRLDELRHQAPGNVVRLRVSSPQGETLEAFAVSLTAAGVSVQSRQLQPQLGRYAAELEVTAP